MQNIELEMESNGDVIFLFLSTILTQASLLDRQMYFIDPWAEILCLINAKW